MKFSSTLLKRVPVLVILLIGLPTSAIAKMQKLPTEKVLIHASPECVFQALRIERDAPECHRKTLHFDGRVAKIDERTNNVPIYGSVHCIWEETEFPYQRMDYKLLESDHFKSGHGSWVIVPGADKRKTTLELRSNLDTGLNIPFGDQLTKISAGRNAKERLSRLKAIAEREETRLQTVISSK